MKVFVCLGALTGVLLLPLCAAAQVAATPRYGTGVYAGGSFPLERLRDSANFGYHAGGMVQNVVREALDVRLDVVFNKLSDKTLSEGATFREVGTNMLFASLGAELHSVRSSGAPRLRKTVAPYLLAGAGVYRFRFDNVCRGAGCLGPERNESTETSWGLNLTGGATAPVLGMSTFIQVGYHMMLPKGASDPLSSLILVSMGLKLGT